MRKTTLLILIFIISNLSLSIGKPVTGQTDVSIDIYVTSPIQNQIYQSNIVPLNFTCEADITSLTDKGYRDDGVVFVLNLDGEPGYHGGNGTRLGQFYPIPSFHNTTMDLPDGNHTLWIDAFFWIRTPDGGQTFAIERLSQIVNFVVSTGTPTSLGSPTPIPSPTPTRTVEPTQSPEPQPEPSPTALVIATLVIITIVCVGSVVYFKKRKAEIT